MPTKRNQIVCKNEKCFTDFVFAKNSIYPFEDCLFCKDNKGVTRDRCATSPDPYHKQLRQRYCLLREMLEGEHQVQHGAFRLEVT